MTLKEQQDIHRIEIMVQVGAAMIYVLGCLGFAVVFQYVMKLPLETVPQRALALGSAVLLMSAAMALVLVALAVLWSAVDEVRYRYSLWRVRRAPARKVG